MLYYLWELKELGGIWAILNILKYISFRAAVAAMSAFLLTIILAPRIISYLRAGKIKEDTTKSDSPELNRRHSSKKDTPTMGGVIVIFATLVSSLLFARIDVLFVILALVVLILFSAIGFLDDYVKLRTSKKGISGKMKLFLQIVVALFVVLVLQQHLSKPESVEVNFTQSRSISEKDLSISREEGFVVEDKNEPQGTSLFFPFFKGVYIPLGALFLLLGVLVIVGSSNAVNLTDGLDGLAAGCSVFVCATFAVLSYVVGRSDFSSYLDIPYVPGAGELSVVCAALTGAILGFLWFNCYPASVFMGDTGSLSLGAVLGTIAISIRQEVLLFLAGGIFVFETFSVILQVVSFQLIGKRVFRIAPFHHHLEFGGEHENRVTIRLWIVGAFLALFALSTLKMR
ncbi:MAG: phospho-N-acetylmuramoyl-pentapeptide-transferase [Planctomycetota bacterium]|nr:phospho-N-acetylmuramoyl-pentapeptide-transferase [Planctomycetota bacterium]